MKRVFGNEFSQSRLREHAEHVENFEYGMIEGRREVLTINEPREVRMTQMTPEVSKLLERALSLSVEEQEALADSLVGG
jgi:hypothetical protein